MMNRTAETLFWIGRYLERAENNAKLIDVNYHMRHLLMDQDDHCNWEKLISSLGNLALFKELYEQTGNKTEDKTALQFLTFESGNPNSLYSVIGYARNNVRALRQLLPTELWESINGFYLWFIEQNINRVITPSPHLFYQRFQEWTNSYHGLAASTMMRDQVWHFIRAGRFFERTENTIRILHNFYTYVPSDIYTTKNEKNYNLFMLLLKSIGGYESFRKIYADNVCFENVMEFFISQSAFPHSVQFALSRTESGLSKIKKQDEQFHGLADAAKQYIEKIKDELTTLQTSKNHEDNLQAIQACFNYMHALGLDITQTFFKEGHVHQ